MMPMSSTRCTVTPSQVPQLPCMSVASGLGNLTSTLQDGSFPDLSMPALDDGVLCCNFYWRTDCQEGDVSLENHDIRHKHVLR